LRAVLQIALVPRQLALVLLVSRLLHTPA